MKISMILGNNSRRIALFLFLLLLISIPLSASMVSVLVVETGLKDGNNAGQYASMWEDSLMRAFFDAGHIVTNGLILRLESMPSSVLPDELERDFREAVEGGADYIVVVFLDFSAVNGAYRPREVTLRLFSAAARAVLYQNTLPAATTVSMSDELFRAREAASAIISALPK